MGLIWTTFYWSDTIVLDHCLTTHSSSYSNIQCCINWSIFRQTWIRLPKRCVFFRFILIKHMHTHNTLKLTKKTTLAAQFVLKHISRWCMVCVSHRAIGGAFEFHDALQLVVVVYVLRLYSKYYRVRVKVCTKRKN